MKKLLLALLLLLIPSLAHAATWYACTGNHNWNGANAWTSVSADQTTCVASTGNPVAGDTAVLNSTTGSNTVTISASAAAAFIDETGYTGTLAFGTQTLTLTTGGNLGSAMSSTSGTISNSGGTITLLSTVTGSFPLLKIAGSQTLASGGFIWPGVLQTAGSFTVTLLGNWVNSGLVSSTTASGVLINSTSSETLTANGGLTITQPTGAGTATIILGGGTWSGTGGLKNSLTFAGNSTISGSVTFNNGTMLYSSGSITTTGSAVTFGGSCTINAASINFNTVNGGSCTLAGNLNANTLNSINISTNFSGAYNITVQNFTGLGGGDTMTITAGQTLNITNSISIFSNSSLGTGLANFLVNSSVGSSPAYINYTGSISQELLGGVSFTDIQASGSTLYNLNVRSAGTLLRTVNISNVTSLPSSGGSNGYIY